MLHRQSAVCTCGHSAMVHIVRCCATNCTCKLFKERIKLLDIDGRLHTPNSAISDKLTREWYGADDPLLLNNDPDSVQWPMVQHPDLPEYTPARYRRILAEALYDARETGTIPADTQSVWLPDGTEFNIEANLAVLRQQL